MTVNIQGGLPRRRTFHFQKLQHCLIILPSPIELLAQGLQIVLMVDGRLLLPACRGNLRLEVENVDEILQILVCSGDLSRRVVGMQIQLEERPFPKLRQKVRRVVELPGLTSAIASSSKTTYWSRSLMLPSITGDTRP